MENKTQIVMIAAEQLQHHPDNPRKTIKDLEELAASIKANGIMQNLTVVPVPDNENEYYIVIGNRRFEAGKIAGISHYPCVISNMDYGKQLETMLIENMQRSDLTIIEQAEGFEQLTLNGFSIEDISNKTGFSQSTVRRRLTVASLDKEKVAEAYSGGATLDEFIKIADIKDEEMRAKLLIAAGTSSFDWRYEHAIKWQRADEHFESTKAQLLEFATETEKELEWKYRENSIDLTAKKIMIPVPTEQEQAENKFYFYLDKTDYTYKFTIFKKPLVEESKEDKKPKESAEEIENRKRHESIEALCNDFNAAVTLFIHEKAKQQSILGIEKIVIKTLLNASMSGTITMQNDSICEFFTGELEYDEDDEIECKILEIVKEEYQYDSIDALLTNIKNIIPDGYLFAMVASQILRFNTYVDYENIVFNYWQKSQAPRFKDVHHETRLLYQFICDCGYRMSDEEKELINGTHKLFAQQESEG